jgi:hypothetical protein
VDDVARCVVGGIGDQPRLTIEAVLIEEPGDIFAHFPLHVEIAIKGPAKAVDLDGLGLVDFLDALKQLIASGHFGDTAAGKGVLGPEPVFVPGPALVLQPGEVVGQPDRSILVNDGDGRRLRVRDRLGGEGKKAAGQGEAGADAERITD